MRACPYCNSIMVCWNWVDMRNTKDRHGWAHECWSCSRCWGTENEVKDGIPYEELVKCSKRS